MVKSGIPPAIDPASGKASGSRVTPLKSPLKAWRTSGRQKAQPMATDPAVLFRGHGRDHLDWLIMSAMSRYGYQTSMIEALTSTETNQSIRPQSSASWLTRLSLTTTFSEMLISTMMMTSTSRRLPNRNQQLPSRQQPPRPLLRLPWLSHQIRYENN